MEKDIDRAVVKVRKGFMNPVKPSTVFSLATTLALMACSAHAGEPMGAVIEYRAYCIADALIERPVGMVLTISGVGLFVATLPFSALGGNAGEACNKLVQRPFKYTFVRPLGRFEE